MTVKRIAALTLGLGLTITAGGASKTVKATGILLIPNGVHNHHIQLHSMDEQAARALLMRQIYENIINSIEFNEQARKALIQKNTRVLEKYLTQKLKEYKKFQLFDKALDEIKKYLIYAMFPDKLPPGKKPIPIPGKGPIGLWPPA